MADRPAPRPECPLLNAGTYFPGRGTIVEQSYLRGYADGFKEIQGAGYEQRLAAAVFSVLEARGVVTSTEARTRIASAMSVDTFSRWLIKSRAATSEADLFTDKPPLSYES
ncbi:hypothetical protein [Streptomyces uncialis]|uniref:hypothetical protein n=1 Tax=Streptomyces uncialis TaxID=1048205 RepID=UPI0033F3F1CC